MTTHSPEQQPSPPLTLDELAALADVPSDPQEAMRAAPLPQRTIHISPIGDTRTDVADLLERTEDGWELRLPEGVVAGRPGRTQGRLDLEEVQEALRAAGEDDEVDPHTAPSRPAGAGVAYQPKRTGSFGEHPTIRRVDGGRLQPFYGIFPPDDRTTYYPGEYPWRCIGKIFTKRNAASPQWSWTGSGVLIGPRHVLTAGHVCPWGSSPWSMMFVPAFYDGASVMGGVSSWVSDFRGWNTNNRVAARDMAVLRLYTPLGSTLGWMGARTYNSSWEGGAFWHLAGYPGAIAAGQRPAWQGGIAVIDDDSDGDALEIEHYGDASPGASGGPLFGFWDADPYAIGPLSGGQYSSGVLGVGAEDNNVNAGGRAMVDLVKWALANWR